MTPAEKYVLSYIENICSNYSTDIDQFDILTFCQIESSLNPLAYRFEPILNEASYGIMQVLESTARDRGFTGDASELFDLNTGLRYGIAQISWIREYLIKKFNKTITAQEIAAAYNEGVGNEIKSVRDNEYVNKWLKIRSEYG